jgi:uncharacterized protein
MTNLQFPFGFADGATARPSDRGHAVEMLLQFLFTHPQDRVNRPDFGTPLVRMVFEGNAAGLTDVIQFITRAGLQRWLGDVIEVLSLVAQPDDSMLQVSLTYRVRGEQTPRTVQRRLPAPIGGAL